MSDRVAARAGWCVFGLVLTFAAAAVVLAALRGSHPLPEDLEGAGARQVVAGAAVATGFGAFGALIVARRSAQPIGWLFLAVGLGVAIGDASFEYAVRALFVEPGALPAGEAFAWVSAWAWIFGVPLIGTVVALHFPTGRLPSARWAPVLWAAVAVLVMLVAAFGLARGRLADFPIENPLGVLPREPVESGVLILFLPILAVCVSSLIVRYRRAEGDERQQLRWVATGAALFLVAAAATLVLPGETPQWAAVSVDLAVALTIGAAGVAVLKYRLYDLELVLNRSLLYAGLSAAVVGIYVGVVAGLGALLDSSGLGVSIAGAAAVAAVVQPLRLVLQTRVDRLIYGDRDDPYRALARLGDRLSATREPGTLLPAVAESVAAGLRLPFVAIEVDQAGQGELVASHGEPTGREPIAIPLEHGGEFVGQLLAEPRPGQETLAAADMRLLGDLGREVAAATHAVRLTSTLRRSREGILAARAEERRRLQRDLHDGLGPMLAGAALEAESARAALRHDEAAAAMILERLPGEVSGAIAEIRRIVHDLRPPTLDELGLVGAVREQAARLDAGSRQALDSSVSEPHSLRVSVEAPEAAPELPAAVEVAAYRIALEALANVSRHADAQRCWVAITASGGLEVAVSDDGVGLPPRPRGGLGLASMRERAEELGGTFTAGGRAGGGTTIRAWLPLGSHPGVAAGGAIAQSRDLAGAVGR